mgnify:FL=1
MSFVGRSRVGSGANGRARFRARARVRVAGMAQLARAAAIVALVFACALVFASPAAFGKVGRGYTLVRLSEVVRSIFYAPQYVALARGFFEDEGLRIDLSTAWGADKGAAALISGACDIGFFGPEAAIYIYNQGAPDYLVGFAQLTQMDGSFFLARAGMPDPFSWEHVRGKTIVGARLGGVPEMVLEWVLKRHGIEPFKDVNIVTSLAFAAAPGAFAAGIGDYIAQFEPSMTELEMAGQGKIVASMGVEGGEIMYTVYHVRRSQLTRDRDMLIRFTRALYQGMNWVEEHTPTETAEVIRPFFPDTKLEVIARIVKRYKDQGTWPATPEVSPSGLMRLQEVMASAGELKAAVPANALVTMEITRAALKSK